MTAYKLPEFDLPAGRVNRLLHIAERSQPRKRPRPWYHPANLLRSFLVAGLMVFLYWLYVRG